MVNLIKIGNKLINIDQISYIDIEEMTIYLNSNGGITEVCYSTDEFKDPKEFKNAIMEVFTKCKHEIDFYGFW